MEYTYNGIVRCGFGFENPNHAAAFLAALIPLCFVLLHRFRHNAVMRFGCMAVTAALIVMCAMTFSRGGIIVVGLELILLVIPSRNWRYGALGVGFLFAAVVAVGALWRFRLDASAVNRLDIVWAGCRLFAANPDGVGHGMSGVIASSAMLPEKMNCRTLVNSHLTLLCEYGWCVGMLWFGAVFYALQAKKYYEVKVALTGLILSAALSSIFDFGVLFSGGGDPVRTEVEYAMTALLTGLWFVLLIFLTIGDFSRRRFAISVGGALILTAALFGIGSLGNAPKIEHRQLLIADGAPDTMTLYDGGFSLRQAVDNTIMENGGWVSLSPTVVPQSDWPSAKRLILLGGAVEFAVLFPECELTLINPPRHTVIPARTTRIILSKRNPQLEKQARDMGITVVRRPI